MYKKVCKDSLYCSDHNYANTLSDIDNAMKKMKRGKGDGYDGLTSDYLINGIETLFYYISVLVSCMLTHCCIPESFSMSTMVPIPKRGVGSMTDVKHYREIALRSLFCKLLDTCIVAKHYENLYSNSLQFAYKPNTSTVQCVSSIIETISYYIDKQSKIFNIYVYS